MTTLMSAAPTGWQLLIRQRLEERDAREKAFDEIIDGYQRLARHTKILRDRNKSMLMASQTSASTAIGNASVSTKGAIIPPAAMSSKEADGTAVKLAYLASLETQLKSAQDELSGLYKTQSQNAQRLISLNEQLRGKDDREREVNEESKRLNDELIKLKRQESDLRGVVGEKDRMIQILQDELSALSLELNQTEIRNDNLKRDNASLLQRWIDRMNDEADKMNDGNQFLQEVEQKKTTREEKATGDSM